MRRSLRGAILLSVIVLAITVAGCGGGAVQPQEVAVQNPTDTALSWFKAIDAGNQALVLDHVTSNARKLVKSSDFGSLRFSHVRCYTYEESANTADVGCKFQVRKPSPDMQNVTGWSLDLQRKGSGPWLISTYGQG